MVDSSAFAAFTAADADVCAILFSPLSMPAEVITSHAVLVQLHCKPVEYQVQTQPNKIMGAPIGFIAAPSRPARAKLI